MSVIDLALEWTESPEACEVATTTLEKAEPSPCNQPALRPVRGWPCHGGELGDAPHARSVDEPTGSVGDHDVRLQDGAVCTAGLARPGALVGLTLDGHDDRTCPRTVADRGMRLCPRFSAGPAPPNINTRLLGAPALEDLLDLLTAGVPPIAQLQEKTVEAPAGVHGGLGQCLNDFGARKIAA